MTQYERPQGNEPYYDGEHLIIPGDFAGNPVNINRNKTPGGPAPSTSHLPDLFTGGAKSFSTPLFGTIPPATGRRDSPTEAFTPDFTDSGPQSKPRQASRPGRNARHQSKISKSSNNDDPYDFLFRETGAGPIVTDTDPSKPAPKPRKVQVRTPLGRPEGSGKPKPTAPRPEARHRRPVRNGLIAAGLTAVALSGSALLFTDEDAPSGQDPLGLIAPATIRPAPAESEAEPPEVSFEPSTRATKRKPSPRAEATQDAPEPPAVVPIRPRPRASQESTYRPPTIVPVKPVETAKPPIEDPWSPDPEPVPSYTLTPSPSMTEITPPPLIEPPIPVEPPVVIEPPVPAEPPVPVEPPAVIEPPVPVEPPQNIEQPPVQEQDVSFWKKLFDNPFEPELPPTPAEPPESEWNQNDDRGHDDGNGNGNGNGNNDRHNNQGDDGKDRDERNKDRRDDRQTDHNDDGRGNDDGRNNGNDKGWKN